MSFPSYLRASYVSVLFCVPNLCIPLSLQPSHSSVKQWLSYMVKGLTVEKEGINVNGEDLCFPEEDPSCLKPFQLCKEWRHNFA